MPRIDSLQLGGETVYREPSGSPKTRRLDRRFTALADKVTAENATNQEALDRVGNFLKKYSISKETKSSAVNKAILADQVGLLSIIHGHGGGVEAPSDQVMILARDSGCHSSLQFLEDIKPSPVIEPNLVEAHSHMTRQEVLEFLQNQEPSDEFYLENM
jgi:hypothetical protein